MPDDNKALPDYVKRCLLADCQATLDDRAMEDTEALRAIPGIIEALRRLESKGINNAAVATSLNIKPQSVNGWKNTGRISKGNLQWLAEKADMSVSQVLNWKPGGGRLRVVESSQPVSDQRAIIAAAMRLVDYIREMATEPLSDERLHAIRLEAIDEVASAGIDHMQSRPGLAEAAANVAARVRSR